MDLELADRRVLVTAASEGLGLSCARRFAREGCRVAICGRRPEALAAAELSLRDAGARDVLAVRADLRRGEDVAALMRVVLERFGGLDVLVCNAGHVAYGGLEDLADEDWYDAFELLLMSTVRLCRAALPGMREASRGSIVVLGSSTIREPPPHLVLSSAMRLGVAGLVKSLARSAGRDGIRVNLVAPGYFGTGRVERRIADLTRSGTTRSDAVAAVAGNVPLGRIGAPEELADLVAFVASGRAAFLSGGHIVIDGAGSRAL